MFTLLFCADSWPEDVKGVKGEEEMSIGESRGCAVTPPPPLRPAPRAPSCGAGRACAASVGASAGSCRGGGRGKAPACAAGPVPAVVVGGA